MTIEIALVISLISVGFGVYQGISNLRRNAKCDDKKDATQLTTVWREPYLHMNCFLV